MKQNILTTRKILHVVSNEWSQALFNVIAEGKSCYDSLVQEGKMTRKQYYPRLAKLVQLDLVKKVGKTYVLTPFGSVIYEAQIVLAMAVNKTVSQNKASGINT